MNFLINHFYVREVFCSLSFQAMENLLFWKIVEIVKKIKFPSLGYFAYTRNC